MKFVISLFLLGPLQLTAQGCHLIKGADPITSKPTLTTGFIDLPGCTLSIDANNKEIDFFFVMSNPILKCLDENTSATVIFDGGKLKGEYKNGGSMNCNGIFHIIFKNSLYTPSPLQRLAAKKIITIRLKGSSEKPFDINLPPELQKTLMDLIGCVITESKPLL